MPMYAVRYTYADDPAALDEHRSMHREFFTGLGEEGVLLIGGRYCDDGPGGALLVLDAGSAEQVRELLREDPFQQQGLVEEVEVREWTPILGALAEGFRRT